MASRLAAVAAAAAAATAAWIELPNSNSVNGCGNVCANNGVYRCLGTFASADACAAACAGAAACAQWTISGSTGHCWTRTDGLWAPVGASGDTAGCNPAVLPACQPPPPPWTGSNVSVAIDTTAPVGVRTHALHPAFTFDFWRSDDPTYGYKWMNSSAITIDLASPALRAAARALAPALLRLGGSPEDSVVFDANGTCVPQSGGAGPAPNGYYCSQVHPYVYDCLTPSRWEALLEFANATGLQITIGLNGCWGRMAADQPMDLTNVRELVAATAASPYRAAFFGFELSNEVVPNTIHAATWGADAAAIRAIAIEAFGENVPIMGPDQGGASVMASVAAATPADTLTALTYHQYPECTAPQPSEGRVLEYSCLRNLDSNAAACAAAATNAPAGSVLPAVWAGETADHSGGGIANLTDTFRSSFYYAWQLGALPAAGVELAARQCLSGGDYELLQRFPGADGQATFAPNPDFWTLWLYKALIGGGAATFNATHTPPSNVTGLRVFPFTASAAAQAAFPGALHALLVVNLGDAPGAPAVSVQLGGPDFVGRARQEWHLTGDVTAPHGRVDANGYPLTVDPVTYALPNWAGIGTYATGPMSVAPASIVFALVF